MTEAMQDQGTGSGFSWGKATTAGLAGIAASVAAAVLYALVTNAIFGPALTPNPQTEALMPVIVPIYGGAAAMFTLVGAFVFMFMMRVGGANAIRNFVIVSVVATLLSFVTVTQPGIAVGDRVQLAVAHVVCALAAVPAMVATYQRR